MHWFWRAIIAVVVAGALGFGLLGPLASSAGNSFTPIVTNPELAVTILIGCLATAVLAVAIYAYLSLSRGAGELETRCRKCRYVLRGITEPRCPECGERI